MQLVLPSNTARAATPSQPAGQAGGLGTAPSSLRVQLPIPSLERSGGNGENLLKALLPSQTAESSSAPSRRNLSRPVLTAHRQPGLLPPPQTSDATLLASSFLVKQAKAREVQAIQDQLIDPPQAFNRSIFKKALIGLSTAHWLQILQERSLSGCCAYPLCNCQPHSAFQQRPAGKFRINVARGTIEPDTRNHPGGRNGFCSDKCYARAEWVRRWVLSPEPGRPEEDAEGPYGDGGIAQAAMRKTRNELAIQGGRWEAMTRKREDEWETIELLEDMEERGELEEWEGFGNVKRPKCLVQPKQTLADTVSTALSVPRSGYSSLSPFGQLTIQERNIFPTASTVMQREEEFLSSQVICLSSRMHEAPLTRRSEARRDDDIFDDLLDNGTKSVSSRVDQDFNEDGGPAASLRRGIEEATQRVQAGNLPCLTTADFPEGHAIHDVDDVDYSDLGALTLEEQNEACAKSAAEKEAARTLDDAMRLREAMKATGEW